MYFSYNRVQMFDGHQSVSVVRFTFKIVSDLNIKNVKWRRV